jgi:4-amino-4-deoxy-L-arabinose transferase-like glycosyltransferase
MSSERLRWQWPVAALALLGAVWVLYLYGLSDFGVVTPDEPRYAAIGRAMAASGDWITPRLWGTPWFEKPALLYWMVAASFAAGVPLDLAPRLPVALLSMAFLPAYWWLLRRAFGGAAAWAAVVFLSTSIGWLAFSQAAVTDLPLAVTAALAMLLLLDLVPDRVPGIGRLCAVAFCLALAVLAKGLVPLVLALPAVWTFRQHWKRLLHPAPWAVFLLTAGPWYLLCWLRNGYTFLDVFFVQHQFGRFVSPAMQHVHPWWYYVPVLLLGMFPWTLIAFAIPRRLLWDDPRSRYLLLWFGFGFVFFSAARNKLPGYLLPLWPAWMALAGLAAMRMRAFGLWMAATALLLLACPLAIELTPLALAGGFKSVFPIPLAAAMHATLLLPPAFLLAVLAYFLQRRGRRVTALLLVAGVFTAAVLVGKRATLPALDYWASARSLWKALPAGQPACVGDVNRNWRYGLNYYTITPLPACSEVPGATVKILPGTRRPVLVTARK